MVNVGQFFFTNRTETNGKIVSLGRVHGTNYRLASEPFSALMSKASGGKVAR